MSLRNRYDDDFGDIDRRMDFDRDEKVICAKCGDEL